MDLTPFLAIDPYSLDKTAKRALLNKELRRLTVYHYENCEPYRKIICSLGLDTQKLPEYDELPFLPVRLFKEYDLQSIKTADVVKTLTSSGTSGQQVSRIFLDKTAAVNQTKVLTKIVTSYIGNKRLPMIILDSDSVIKNRAMFSARGAGIIGFSIFGSEKVYAFDDDMKLNIPLLKDFLENHSDKTIFIFGFTYMVWKYFYQELVKMAYKPNLSKAILIHGGGWKKLAAEAVSSQEFKQGLHAVCGIEAANIHDYYGMVEQTGTIYLECEHGYLHAPLFSDVLIRRSRDFSLAKNGEKGIIEVVSILPESYPGHILLTEDEGTIAGEDDCPCGRLGKYFTVHGRVKGAEIRGCGDTYEQR
ncbi:acyl-protein synthetase [Spirochaetia bacterium]|nr:acyl-protein synthetase [Spirochaetia bacterium]